MSIAFHPSETTLLDYAGGALKLGARLVVTSHLEGCAACRADVAALEAAAGAMMASLEPAQLDEHALALALARIERPEPARRRVSPPSSTALLSDVEVPACLRRADIGRTCWIAPGVRLAKVRGGDPGERLYLLRAASGRRIIRHGHSGDEYTYVLKGGFKDAQGAYLAGDLIEAGVDVVHSPVVDRQGDCVCLIVSDGKMRVRGWLPRILQSIFGI